MKLTLALSTLIFLSSCATTKTASIACPGSHPNKFTILTSEKRSYCCRRAQQGMGVMCLSETKESVAFLVLGEGPFEVSLPTSELSESVEALDARQEN